jgi:hypothetical protein
MVANLVQLQDKLKDLSDKQLRDIYSKGTVPQFLVMTEMGRRKEMQEEYQRNQQQQATTVAQDLMSPATDMARTIGGMAQPQNRMSMQGQDLPIEQSMTTMPMSPQPMANKLPVTSMANGGLAKINKSSPRKMDIGGALGMSSMTPLGSRNLTPFQSSIMRPPPDFNPFGGGLKEELNEVDADLSGLSEKIDDVGEYAERRGNALAQGMVNQINNYENSIQGQLGTGAYNNPYQRFLDNPRGPRPIAGKGGVRMGGKPLDLLEVRDPQPASDPQPANINQQTQQTMADGGLAKIKAQSGFFFNPQTRVPNSATAAATEAYRNITQSRAAEDVERTRLAQEQLANQQSAEIGAPPTDPVPFLDFSTDSFVRTQPQPNLLTSPSPASGGGLGSLQTDLGTVAARTYTEDPSLIPTSLTQAETATSQALDAIDPNAKSIYDDFVTDLEEKKGSIEERKDDAAGWALIEAALRVAGSKSPNIGQAAAEAVPAISSYRKDMSSIRKEQDALMNSRLKLTQLQEAEKAGRKKEASDLRSELRGISGEIRDIKDKAKRQFNELKTADINVLKARISLENARGTNDFQRRRVELMEAQEARENRTAEVRADRADTNINELKTQLANTPEGDTTERQRLGNLIRAEQQAKQSAIAQIRATKARVDPYAGQIAATNIDSRIIQFFNQRTKLQDAKQKAQKDLAYRTGTDADKAAIDKQYDDQLARIDKSIREAQQRKQRILSGRGGSSGAGGVTPIQITPAQLSQGSR